MEALQAHILALLTAVVGIVVGFGVIDNTLAGEIISAGGIVLGAVFSAANVFHVKIGAEAATAVKTAQIAKGVVVSPPVQAQVSAPPKPADALSAGEVSKLQAFAANLAGGAPAG